MYNKSSLLFKESQTCIPGGVNSPVRAFRSVGMDPLFISHAKGSQIYDVDGNCFIDYVCSWGPMILGHSHPAVNDAIKKQVDLGASYGAPTEKELQIAKIIIDAVPSIEKVRLVNSGTEATMSAIRVARGFTGRDKIIKFEGCYHGHADSLLVKAGSGALTFGAPDSPGVPQDFAKLTLTAEFNNINSVKNLIDRNRGQIAAVIVEPIPGNMGVVEPNIEFLRQLREITLNEKIVLIFDEVMSGFRVSFGGAQALYNITPDMTTLGKIIGGGLPIGAFGGRSEIMEHVSPSGKIYQAGTLSGNPLAVTSGIETLNILKSKDIYLNLENKSKKLTDGMKEIISKTSIPHCFKRVGSMFCLFFTNSDVQNFKDATTSDTALFSKYFKLMLNNGVYLAPSQYEAGFISIEHSDKDIEKTLNAFEKSIKALSQ